MAEHTQVGVAGARVKVGDIVSVGAELGRVKLGGKVAIGVAVVVVVVVASAVTAGVDSGSARPTRSSTADTMEEAKGSCMLRQTVQIVHSVRVEPALLNGRAAFSR